MKKHDKSAIFTIGRRKTSIARIKLQVISATTAPKETQNSKTSSKTARPNITINKHNLEKYFPTIRMQKMATAPLDLLNMHDQVIIQINVSGGGTTGQADACSLGIARSLELLKKESRIPLKRAGLLKRDPRSVERKKYGLHKARKSTQFSKR